MHLATMDEEVAHAVVDMVVDRPILKRDVRRELPRAMFGAMNGFPFIVLIDAPSKVCRRTYVIPTRA